MRCALPVNRLSVESYRKLRQSLVAYALARPLSKQTLLRLPTLASQLLPSIFPEYSFCFRSNKCIIFDFNKAIRSTNDTVMKKGLLTVLLLLVGLTSFAQIDMADSTVQVVPYWNKGSKLTYIISSNAFVLKGSDTINRLANQIWEVDVSTIDSTDSSYIIEWDFKKHLFDGLTGPKEISDLVNTKRIVYKTDGLGMFIELVNTTEIIEYHKKIQNWWNKNSDSLSGPDSTISQQLLYSEAVVLDRAVRDVMQFHWFHGGVYRVGEILEGEVSLPHSNGTDFLDCQSTTYFEEFDDEIRYFTLKEIQVGNPEQLHEARFKYLTLLAEKNGTEPSKPEDIKDIRYERETSNTIHASGWLFGSLQRVVEGAGDSTLIEEQYMILKQIATYGIDAMIEFDETFY